METSSVLVLKYDRDQPTFQVRLEVEKHRSPGLDGQSYAWQRPWNVLAVNDGIDTVHCAGRTRVLIDCSDVWPLYNTREERHSRFLVD